MQLTAIRSDRICHAMMNATPDAKDSLFRGSLMGLFAHKRACIGTPLQAERAGDFDVVSAAMSGYRTPAQVTPARRREIGLISSTAFWTACESSIRRMLEGLERRGIRLPQQAYVFTVLLSDPDSPMTQLAGDGCGDSGIHGYILGSIVPGEQSLALLPAAPAHETNHNVRWQFQQWRSRVTLADMIVLVGLAEVFAAGMFGEDKVGRWVRETTLEALAGTVRPLIRKHLVTSDFQELSSYSYGDDIMAMRVGQPVGMLDCGGYACRCALIRHYPRKTGASIHEATITPTVDILRHTADFWG